MQFYLQSAVAEKGIGEEELRLEQADAIGGSIWTNVIAIFIVVATAATIHAVGGSADTAEEAARGLAPVAGELSSALFAVGLFGASVLAATIMPISTAFVICEAFGWESGVDKRFEDARPFFGIYTFVLGLGALVVLIPGLDLLPLIVASQNLQGLLLPVVLVFMVLLVNDPRIMGRHRNGPLDERPRLGRRGAGDRARRGAARGHGVGDAGGSGGVTRRVARQAVSSSSCT